MQYLLEILDIGCQVSMKYSGSSLQKQKCVKKKKIKTPLNLNIEFTNVKFSSSLATDQSKRGKISHCIDSDISDIFSFDSTSDFFSSGNISSEMQQFCLPDESFSLLFIYYLCCSLF